MLGRVLPVPLVIGHAAHLFQGAAESLERGMGSGEWGMGVFAARLRLAGQPIPEG
jgi:hypothetical protein